MSILATLSKVEKDVVDYAHAAGKTLEEAWGEVVEEVEKLVAHKKATACPPPTALEQAKAQATAMKDAGNAATAPKPIPAADTGPAVA